MNYKDFNAEINSLSCNNETWDNAIRMKLQHELAHRSAGVPTPEPVEAPSDKRKILW